MLRASEFLQALDGASRPFRAYGSDQNGQRIQLCVKPRLRGRPGNHLVAEWCGYKIAECLAVPVPTPYLVDVNEEFIRSSAGQLDDVEPGIGFGSEWQTQTFPFQLVTSSNVQIENRDSVAGVGVLDTVQQNGDRHESNVLLLPVLSPAAAAFSLCYIDNADAEWWTNDYGNPLQARVPGDSLARLVTSEEQFMEYFFRAEGLSETYLVEQFGVAPADMWVDSVGIAQELAARAVQRGLLTRAVVMASLNRFPNLDGDA